MLPETPQEIIGVTVTPDTESRVMLSCAAIDDTRSAHTTSAIARNERAITSQQRDTAQQREREARTRTREIEEREEERHAGGGEEPMLYHNTHGLLYLPLLLRLCGETISRR